MRNQILKLIGEDAKSPEYNRKYMRIYRIIHNGPRNQKEREVLGLLRTLRQLINQLPRRKVKTVSRRFEKFEG